ncbi:hypothetical protein [Streptomyces griseorubiginosus]|nr:hypothetical protein [Streptomyces griseorubiginosus]
MTRTAEKTPRKTVMTKDEWIAQHLRRAPVRDEEWVQRLLVLQGKA